VQLLTSSIDGRRRTLAIREVTTLRFAHIEDGAPESTTYAAQHEFDIEHSQRGLAITAARWLPENAYSTPLTQFDDKIPRAVALNLPGTTATPIDQLSPARATDLDAGIDPMVGQFFNPTAAVAYAHKWALSFNPAYPKWSEDCTNFVSQCMLAGHWTTVGKFPTGRTNSHYWYHGKYERTSSYTWAGAANFCAFTLYKHGNKLPGYGSMEIADVLAYRFSGAKSIGHVQICTKVKGSSHWMSQHSGAYKDKPLSEILRSAVNKKANKTAIRTY
jgi:hypothetical protein